MARSPAKPKPVAARKYRYSKLRWRISVRAVDGLGRLLAGAWRRARPPRPVEAPRKILVVQLDHLGDAVLTSPLIAQLKSAFPDAAIDVLASSSNHEVFEANANVSRVRIARRTWFERGPARRGFIGTVWGLGRSLRDADYDLGIDVRGDILSILVLALAGIPRRIGWAMGGGGFMLTDVVPWVPGRHETRSRLALLRPLGIVPAHTFRTEVHVADDDRAAVARRLADDWPARRPQRKGAFVEAQSRGYEGAARDHQRPAVKSQSSFYENENDWFQSGPFAPAPPLLAVHLGAGTAAKRWPPRAWNQLIGRFIADQWRVVIVGGPEDAEWARFVEPSDSLRDWTGRLTVAQTAALLERADLFIGADSGPAHLAASAGTRSVVLFSGTNRPGQWRPWSRQSLVLRHRVPCNPCHQKACPLADHPCMTGLRPDRVYRTARRWWLRSLVPGPIKPPHPF
jgi:heptosyltransferase-2